MPSKGRKSSKSDRSPIPRSPSTPASARRPEPVNSSNDEEHHLRNLLSEASARFPSFINESAIVARICDCDSDFSKGNQARVWLSDSAMRSKSLIDKSLVSVSLPASGEKSPSDFPLDSLAEECATRLAVDIADNKSNGVGNYFAIATVFRSPEDLKDGIRLSWGLSCTVGVPDIGRSVFVCPVRSFDCLNNDISTTHVRLDKCKDLHLSLVPPKVIPATSSNVHTVSVESASVNNDNGITASPKTPSSTPKLLSPVTTPVHPGKPHDFMSKSNSAVCPDISSVRLALTDEQSNEFLQKSAARWLYGRFLLGGNIVTIPLIFGQVCAFQVESAERSLTSCDIEDLIHKEELVLSSRENQVNDSCGEVDVAFLVDNKTNVYLSDPIISIGAKPNKVGMSGESLSCRSTRGKEPCGIRRLGGLSKEFAALKEIITFSLRNKGHLPRYKGVLLHGPPGTGKTSLAAACARDAGATLFSINGPEIVSQYYGGSEQALYDAFDSARQAAPAVVFIDELDAIAPTRKDGGEELSLRMVATLLKLMDDIKRDDGILVIAATNRPDSIDPALRRPGRLDREIEIGVPSPEQRWDILRAFLSGMDHSLSDIEVQGVASETHAFVGADLAALCNEAAMIALRRYIKTTNSDNLCSRSNEIDSYIQGSEIQRNADGITVGVIDSLSSALSELSVSPEPVCPISSQRVHENGDTFSHELNKTNGVEEQIPLEVTAEDFMKAKMKVRPSAMREVMLELPKVRWEDVGGQEKAKKQLIEAVQWPQMHPDAFKRIGIRPPRGLLMIGPPGCSKTLMARAVASEAKLNFLAVKGPELFNKWVGESEKAVRSSFAKARANSPAIIFFDEIDGLAIARGEDNDGSSVADRVLSQLLVEMDGLDQRLGVTVIAATNRPDKIDPALLRPGRFDRLLDVQPPNAADREDIFRIHTRDIPCHQDVCLSELARLTDGYTGADIKLVCREAALAALEESFEMSEVSTEHFKIGIGRVHPSDVQFYMDLAKQFRRIVDNEFLRDK